MQITWTKYQKLQFLNKVWWCVTLRLALRRLRKEVGESETSLDYITGTCLKRDKERQKQSSSDDF